MVGLRVVLVLVWLVAQALGLLVGGWATLGLQMGQRGVGVLGLVLLTGPAIVAGVAWWWAGRSDPAAARMILLAAIAALIVGTGALLVVVGGAGGA